MSDAAAQVVVGQQEFLLALLKRPGELDALREVLEMLRGYGLKIERVRVHPDRVVVEVSF